MRRLALRSLGAWPLGSHHHHVAVRTAATKAGAKNENLLEFFSDLDADDLHSDKELLFSFLKHMPGTAREVSRFLKLFSSTENHRFAVIKIGGAVVEENLDELAKQLAFLHRVGLYPTVVHGGGPQLNDALSKAGITHEFVDGLRVSTEEVMMHALPVFERQNSMLVDALEARGVRARPLLSGVFEAKLLDRAKYGLVGEVVSCKTDMIIRSIRAKTLPIVASVGATVSGTTLNINADMAASSLATALKPLKTVYLNSLGGLMDQNDQRIPVISMAEDYNFYMSQSWFRHGSRLKLREIKELLEALPSGSTVCISKASDLLKELFTYSGAGTMFLRGTPITKAQGPTEIAALDWAKLERTISAAFGRQLVDGYRDMLLASGDDVRIYYTENMAAAAIIRTLPGTSVPYMDKFVVDPRHQRMGLAEMIMNRLCIDYPQLFWRSREQNPINIFYRQQSDGTFSDDKWRVFWIGQFTVDQVTPLIKAAMAAPETLRSIEAPSVVRRLSTSKARVGIIGARGYTGNELMKLLIDHPSLELAAVSSRQLVGKRISSSLRGMFPGSDAASGLDLRYVNLDAADICDFTKSQNIDAWVMALPNGVCAPFVQALGDMPVTVVDLSADYRFDPDWQYGFPERFRERIRSSKRIANPGCYATGAQVALLPYAHLLSAINPSNVFGVSGYSGAGTNPSDKNDPDLLRDNLMAYSLQGHMHEREIGHQLHHPVRFMPHVAPHFQGIHLTVSMTLAEPLRSADEAYEMARDRFKNEPLIKILKEPPQVRNIARRHHVEVGGFTLDKTKVKLVACATIDNLLKGAATQCLQNLNLSLGIDDELEGIREHLVDPAPPTFPYAKKKPTMNFEQAQALDEKYVTNTYGKRQELLHRGAGSRAYNDASGKEYVDFVAGIAVNVFGHSDAEWAAVLARQSERLAHTSNLYYTEEQAKLAQKLVTLTPWSSKVFFANTGTEANEAAIKFARKRGVAIAPNKTRVIAFKKGFHGRTMGSLSVTEKPAYRRQYGAMVDFGPEEKRFISMNDMTAFAEAMDDSVCAVIVEPIQGEGGVNEARPEFLHFIRELCTRHGALMIVDEVQCGLGRTGDLWAHQAAFPQGDCTSCERTNCARCPDMMTVAKPIAGGLAAAAVLCNEEASKHLVPGDHGTTFGGSPLTAAAALYVLDRVANPEFLRGVTEAGAYMRESVSRIKGVTGVRGRGLISGFDAPVPSADLVAWCRSEGLFIHSAGPNTIRLIPPLNISLDDIDAGMDILATVLKQKLAE